MHSDTKQLFKFQHPFWAETNCHSFYISECTADTKTHTLQGDINTDSKLFFPERKHKKCYYKTLCNTNDISYKSWVSQSSVAKDSSLLGCDNESYSKWLLTFQRTIVPSSSGFSRPRRFLHALFDPSHCTVMNHSCHKSEGLHSIDSLILWQTSHNSWSSNTSWLQDDCYPALAAKSRTQRCDLLVVYWEILGPASSHGHWICK